LWQGVFFNILNGIFEVNIFLQIHFEFTKSTANNQYDKMLLKVWLKNQVFPSFSFHVRWSNTSSHTLLIIERTVETRGSNSIGSTKLNNILIRWIWALRNQGYAFYGMNKDRVEMKWFDSKAKALKGLKSWLKVKKKESIWNVFAVTIWYNCNSILKL
jgi:hypothetical protein